MKTTMSWRSNKPVPKPKRTKHKSKVPWELLGIPNPAEEKKAVSMEEIRHQVVLMSSRDFGQVPSSDLDWLDMKDRELISDPETDTQKSRRN